jgi:hypothetical protein
VACGLVVESGVGYLSKERSSVRQILWGLEVMHKGEDVVKGQTKTLSHVHLRVCTYGRDSSSAFGDEE